MVDMGSPSVASHIAADHVRAVLEKAENLQIDTTQLLRQCGLSFDLEHLKDGTVSSLPFHHFVKLRQLCVLAIRSKLDGEQQGMMLEEFQLMCHCVISSLSLKEALERISCFLSLGGDRFGWAKLTTENDVAQFEIGLRQPERDWEEFFAVNAVLLFARLFEWLIGEPLACTYSVRLPASRDSHSICGTFNMKVVYGAASNAIIFPTSKLDRPIVRSASQLHEFLTAFPDDVVLAESSAANLGDRIAAIYRSALQQGHHVPTISELARVLGVSEATLRRRLLAERVAFQNIKDNVRTEIAQQFLADGIVNIDRIAHQLDYSSSRAFARAFQRCTGLSPTTFRKQFGAGEPQRRSEGEWHAVS